jgi:hypothetical protein
MIAISPPALCAVVLLMIPAGCASVVSGNPVRDSGSPASSSSQGMGTGNEAKFNDPGGTGRTIVPGSQSTIAGDAAASKQQRLGSMIPSN